LAVILIAVCSLGCCTKQTGELPEAPTAPTAKETVTEPVAETMVATEPPTPPETKPLFAFYDVPLSEGLQLHIINRAEERGIDPAIIFAMAYRESTYNANCIGDGGESFGLLQIQPKWHYGRMLELGCTDLLDPYQNVVVAIDYLAENLERYGDIAKALVAYNRGTYDGTITQYAKNVLATAEQINNERSQ
jgi:soluble lytic murein transglycosylase-like protein